MKPARSIDITAKTSAELREQFDIKLTDTKILLWRKPSQAATEEADIALPKFLFRADVLKDLEQNFL